jgi:hypothetical protein
MASADRRTPACHHNRLSDLIRTRITKAADAEPASRSAFGRLASERATPAIYSAASKQSVCQRSGRSGRASSASQGTPCRKAIFWVRATALSYARRAGASAWRPRTISPGAPAGMRQRWRCSSQRRRPAQGRRGGGCRRSPMIGMRDGANLPGDIDEIDSRAVGGAVRKQARL